MLSFETLGAGWVLDECWVVEAVGGGGGERRQQHMVVTLIYPSRSQGWSLAIIQKSRSPLVVEENTICPYLFPFDASTFVDASVYGHCLQSASSAMLLTTRQPRLMPRPRGVSPAVARGDSRSFSKPRRTQTCAFDQEVSCGLRQGIRSRQPRIAQGQARERLRFPNNDRQARRLGAVSPPLTALFMSLRPPLAASHHTSPT